MLCSLSRKCIKLQNLSRMLKIGIHSVNELNIDKCILENVSVSKKDSRLIGNELECSAGFN